MSKFTLLLLTSLLSSLQAIVLDIPYLKQQIAKNPNDTTYRIILAKYYLKNFNIPQASHYIEEIAHISPQNTQAQKLQQKLQTLLRVQRKYNLSQITPSSCQKKLDALFEEKKFTTFLKLFKTAKEQNIPLPKETQLNAAYAYALTEEFDKAKSLLKIYPVKTGTKRYFIEALLALKNSDLQRAKNALLKLQKENPKSYETILVTKKLKNKRDQYLQQSAKTLKQTNSFTKLQEYIYLLNQQHRNNEAIGAVKTFIKRNPKNIDAKILLAKLLYWNGKLDRAFHTLYAYRLTNEETKRLYANILYEKGDYLHALVYLPEVAKSAPTKKERYNLLKRTAFAYMYMHKENKANQLFHKLLQKNPHDQEIKKALQTNRANAILNQAIAYHKNKELDKALQTYKEYYTLTQTPNIAKEIAEIYYFDQKYKEALPYFQTYLSAYPQNHLIRFHYASALSKEKQYPKSIDAFSKVVQSKDPKLYYLAKYHLAKNLMQTQNEQDWLRARETLQTLFKELKEKQDPSLKELYHYCNENLKIAQGPVLKPRYYKDIVLTEGAKKIINRAEVFSDVKISSTTKPSLKTLLHITTPKQIKMDPKLRFESNYVKDSQIKHQKHRIQIEDFLVANGIRYSVEAEKFYFESKKEKKESGENISIKIRKENLTIGIGIDQFTQRNQLVPSLLWNRHLGMHHLYLNLFYRNGAFGTYRNCMIKENTNYLHVGIYDDILLQNLENAQLAMDINAYENHNINLYGSFFYPLYTQTTFGLEHQLIFNENIDYNTKTNLCYSASHFYDSTYLKYQPTLLFKNGHITASFGGGYAFKNKEYIYTLGLKGLYTLQNIATFELNCERLKSSITQDNVDYCTLNIIQEW